jgi:hypothetical protein
MFSLVVNKAKSENIILKMYLAEICKILMFILTLSLVFKLLPVDPAVCIISVLIFVIMNFAKNLLKLIL